MISIAAAITIPETNAAKQENTSRSLRTTLMAASPCRPWSKRRAHLYRGRKVIEWNFGTISWRVAFADPNNRASPFKGGLREATTRPVDHNLRLICASPDRRLSLYLQMETAPKFPSR